MVNDARSSEDSIKLIKDNHPRTLGNRNLISGMKRVVNGL